MLALVEALRGYYASKPLGVGSARAATEKAFRNHVDELRNGATVKI